MAYFANGTEQMIFEDTVCKGCKYQGDCQIMDLHMLYNYDECNNKDSILHKAIPCDEDGFSRKCNFKRTSEGEG